MTLTQKSESFDRRTANGMFEWREEYKSKFEHCFESLAIAQDDCNNLTQKLGMAKTPYEFALAWNEYTQRRMSHLGQMFEGSMAEGWDWKSFMTRLTDKTT